MSNFFEKSDLSRNEAENIISETLQKCDDGELYLENSKSESILLDDNKIKNSNYTSDLGFGFRAISDEIVAYSHSNEISKNSLNYSGKLKNKTFMFTGKLKDISRAEAKSLIEQNSGGIVSSVSKKLNYLVIGEKPTNRKVDLAKQLGVKILTQKEWSDLLN